MKNLVFIALFFVFTQKITAQETFEGRYMHQNWNLEVIDFFKNGTYGRSTQHECAGCGRSISTGKYYILNDSLVIDTGKKMVKINFLHGKKYIVWEGKKFTKMNFVQTKMPPIKMIDAHYRCTSITFHDLIFYKNGTLFYETCGDKQPTPQQLKARQTQLSAHKPNGVYKIKGDTILMKVGNGKYSDNYKIPIIDQEEYIIFRGDKLYKVEMPQKEKPVKIKKRKKR
jgi:hypothetical protein